MVHFLALTAGTPGDVNPYLGLGTEMLALGHRFTLCANEHFQAEAVSRGLDFVATGSRGLYEKFVSRTSSWDSFNDIAFVWERHGLPKLDQHVKALSSAGVGDDTVLIGSIGVIALRFARDYFRRPFIGVGLSPYQYRPVQGEHRDHRGFGAKGRRRARLARIRRQIRRLYRLHGLRGRPGALRIWRLSPDLNIGLWPRWFMDPEAEWGAAVQPMGFCLDDGGYRWMPDSGLLAFLEKRPLLVFGGSGVESTHLFRPAAEAAKSLGFPVLFVRQSGWNLSDCVDLDAYAIREAAFSGLMPRCRAVVHPGGIGTIARALQAGLPQIVGPFANDQFLNAEAVVQLKAGTVWRRGEVMTESLSDLLGDKSFDERSGEWRKRMNSTHRRELARSVVRHAERLMFKCASERNGDS